MVTPFAHAHHRGLLVETAARFEFCNAEVVVVERQDTEQPQPGAPDRDAEWLRATMAEMSRRFGTRVESAPDGVLTVNAA